HQCHPDHPDLHSFPTRRSSDLDPNAVNPIDKLIDRTQFPNLPTIKGDLLFAGINGADRRAGNVDWTAIQPRIGFAYQLTSKMVRSEEHTSELQSRENLVCRLLL